MHTSKNPYRVKLTRQDCAEGYHNFVVEPGGILAHIEVCQTCGEKVFFDKKNPNNKEWARKHKLDLLQPYGKTAKAFRKYYGEPVPISEIRKQVR